MSGRLLGGRYRLDEHLASGGMGQVWRATDEVLHREVAVKLLAEALGSDGEFVERFRAEARHTAALSHRGIAQIYDYGEETADAGTSQAYIVMEFVPGEPLSAVLSARAPLPVDEVLALLSQVGFALGAAHAAGVVHRDVKPGNLMVTPAGEVKITDFGIARAMDASPVTRTGTVLGTAFYLSPEQARGQGAGPRSDLYALGVVAYECLTGGRPFTGESPIAVALAHGRDPVPLLPASIPPAVRALVEELLAKDPDDRPATGAALAARASALRGSAAVAALPDDTVDPDATRILPVAGGSTDATTQVCGPSDATTVQPAAGAGLAAGAVGAVSGLTGAGPRAGAGPGAAVPPTGPYPAPPQVVPSPGQAERGRRTPVVLATVAGLLAAGGIAYAVTQDDDAASTTSAPVVSTSPSADAGTARAATPTPPAAGAPPGSRPSASAPPETVAVPTGLVGLDADEAQSRLEDLGLDVERDEEPSPEPEGRVLAVAPDGSVPVGSTVTLTLATPEVDPAPEPSAPVTTGPQPSAGVDGAAAGNSNVGGTSDGTGGGNGDKPKDTKDKGKGPG